MRVEHQEQLVWSKSKTLFFLFKSCLMKFRMNVDLLDPKSIGNHRTAWNVDCADRNRLSNFEKSHIWRTKAGAVEQPTTLDGLALARPGIFCFTLHYSAVKWAMHLVRAEINLQFEKSSATESIQFDPVNTRPTAGITQNGTSFIKLVFGARIPHTTFYFFKST